MSVHSQQFNCNMFFFVMFLFLLRKQTDDEANESRQLNPVPSSDLFLKEQ